MASDWQRRLFSLQFFVCTDIFSGTRILPENLRSKNGSDSHV